MDLRRYQRILYRLLINRNYRFLRRKKLFDSGYFLENCRGWDIDSADPLWNYLKISGNDYQDLLRGGRWMQQADPHPLFDTAWYLLRYFPDGLADNPLVHYLKEGWRLDYWPGPFLDPRIYAERSDYRPTMGDPLSHYTHVGAQLGISPSPYFDVPYYLDWNPGLTGLKPEIIKHYKLYGGRNSRSPIPVFDPAYYLSQLEDPEASETDPLSSYVTMSDRQQCNPGPWFKPEHYRLAEDLGQEEEPLAHYLKLRNERLKDGAAGVGDLSGGPLLSILVPVYNPAIEYLNNCVNSVLHQEYSHWELCLADDCSTDAEVHETLRQWADRDARIKVSFRQENGGISAATNSAAELAEGDYLGFLDNDDELSPDCLQHVADQIIKTGAKVLYTDEDLIGNDGTRFSIFHKPDFNLGLLFTHNFITHFVAVEKKLFDEIGGFDPECDGAQDYDLMLRLTEESGTVLHIPRVLYHWRASETSTSINHEQKSYAHEAGKTALARSIQRRNIGAAVEESGTNFFYRLKYERIEEPSVDILVAIPSGNEDDIQAMVRDSARYGNCTIRPIHYEAAQPQERTTTSPARPEPVATSADRVPGAGLAESMHRGVRESSGEYLVFLTSDLQELASGWLEELLCPLLQIDTLGMVCGRVDTDGEGKSSFRLPDLSVTNIEYFSQFLAKCTRHMNWLHCHQYVSFCDWDICMIKRTVYDEHGGLDWEQYPARLAMLDLSMKVSERGWDMLYTPYALGHVKDETQTLPDTETQALREERLRFQKNWAEKLRTFDTYFNPGLLGDSGIGQETFKRWLCGELPERKG